MSHIRRVGTAALTLVVSAVLPAAALAVAPGASAAAASAGSLTSLVNPFVGTENFGNTFPGASAPFGMVQVSPDTGGQGGYDYKASSIYGFSQTHLSGVGCGVVGELPMMPTTGAVTTSDHTKYASPFTHTDEQATPGYYRVGLSRYGIDAELTATDRTGWQRYTFPTGGQHNVLLNTGQANMPVLDSQLQIVDDHTVEGAVHDGGFCAGHDQHTVYFTATFDHPFSSVGTWTGDTLSPGSTTVADGSGNRGAWVSFGGDTTKVTAKVALSYTGLAGARKNLQAETGTGFDFDATRAALTKRWNHQLSLARIGGGSHDRRVAYYTSLYHAMLHPNLAGDVDGSYFGFDGTVHKAKGYTPRQNFSLWDTYRTQNQLVEMLAPQVARDDALSLLAIGHEGGWLPRWALANSETNIMTGDPVTPTLVELWSKGFLAGHEADAYAQLRKYVTQLPPADSQYNGRAGVQYYDKLGYIPYGLTPGKDCPDHGGDNDCVHPASATLEYSAADAALSTMAAGLGHAADARMFAQRGRWYRNLWDQRIKQFRPRLPDGTFLSPYDPVSGDTAFHESGAYQYTWLVPQDPAGLTQLLGGRAATRSRLDSFFAYDDVLADPTTAVHDDWVSSPYDYYAKSTYNPNNEPDLLAPYMYTAVGKPDHTATVLRAADTLFTTGPDGMTGNDDLGEMSSWYVLSSLGVYPTMSGAGTFTLNSPQFPSATVTIGRYGRQQGGVLHIGAPGASDSRRYITSATVNGRRTQRSWVRWSSIRHGGALDYTMSTKPGSWATRPADAAPSTDPRANDHRVTLSGTASSAAAPTGATSVTITASAVAQWPGSRRLTQTVTPPAGWSAQPATTTRTVRSAGLPVGVDTPVRLEVPAGTAAGTYPVTVVMRAPGVATVTRHVTVSLQHVACASSGAQCALALKPDLDGTATTADPASGNFDGGGWSYDAALLPAAGSTTLGGTTYVMPNPDGTAKNFLTMRGQQFALPAGKYSTLNVIGAAHGGDVTSQAVVSYTDGTSAAVPFVLSDWASSTPASGDTVAIGMAHRIKAGQGVDGPPVNLYATTLKLDPTKTVQSIAAPNAAGAEVYAATLR
ncbi:GH92 family glycosyl hydrolase [uncultured Jatrophihabitans sp.]|uniref:GH92 family glycosyl hydrolase n=1 Tax=uncultured Jatrophihabitans sp. TaxID=1610747 RepID=UPI0035C95F33